MDLLQPTQLNEQELVERAKTDQAAFRQLYDLYFPKIYAFTIKRTGHQETAEDITSETFMKAFVHIESYRYKGYSFGAWLYRISANLITDHYRKNKKLSDADIDELPEMHDEKTADESAIKNELSEAVERLMSELPERERKVVELKFFAELSNQEISDVIDETPNNVGVILFRALKKCKKLSSITLTSY